MLSQVLATLGLKSILESTLSTCRTRNSLSAFIGDRSRFCWSKYSPSIESILFKKFKSLTECNEGLMVIVLILLEFI